MVLRSLLTQWTIFLAAQPICTSWLIRFVLFNKTEGELQSNLSDFNQITLLHSVAMCEYNAVRRDAFFMDK